MTTSSVALLTDLYELTMASAYRSAGRGDDRAVFNLFFRRSPFRGGFTVAAGLAPLLQALERFRFEDSDVDYLATLPGDDGRPLFPQAFLNELRGLSLTCDVDAVPEGTVVFPEEPLLRVTGPIFQAQLLESLLLNIVNFQSLIATKAARMALAAEGQPILEFGLRRAQGVDGALAASRAAYLGGCSGTSNVLAGKLYGIPVRGTHAHSWVMSFEDEEESFHAWADAMPNNAVFLVDTYDSLEGVKNAIASGKRLREHGHELAGIRVDSGDLAALSLAARRMLDDAGFPNAFIVASNELDEGVIRSLKEQGAAIGVWGVGTRLVTAFDDPALGGVYKLAALKKAGGDWQYKVKLSEQAIKTSIPGIQQVRRYAAGGTLLADVIVDELRPPSGPVTVVDPLDHTRRRTIPEDTPYTELLVPVLRGGARVGMLPSLQESRQRLKDQLDLFPAGVKRFVNPHQYMVGLEKGLFDLRTNLILKARGVPA